MQITNLEILVNLTLFRFPNWMEQTTSGLVRLCFITPCIHKTGVNTQLSGLLSQRAR